MSLVLGIAAILRRPDLTTNEAFLFADPALNLIAAEHALGGKQIYVDAAFQYGPLSIYAYTGLAALAGNTPRTYLAFLLLWSIVSVVLAYSLLRSRVSAGTTALVVAGGLTTTMLIPGSLAGAQLSSTYIPMERAALLLVALTWTPPARRTLRRAALLGFILGAWQGLRFGAALFAGIAVVLVDVLAMVTARSERPSLAHWLRTNLTTLGVFLAVEAAWVAHAFATLPRHAALDLVWPAYILDSYLIAPPGTRSIVWSGTSYFVGQLLVPTMGLLATLTVLAWAVRPSWRPAVYRDASHRFAADLRLMVPAMFYLVGIAFYFRTVWHFQQFFWALVIPIGLVLAHGRWVATGAFVALAAPAVALIMRVMLLTPVPAGVIALDTPRGDRLWVDPSIPPRLAHIVDSATTPTSLRAGESPSVPALFIVPMGTGVHHFFKLEMPTRQSWFIPGFGRPADEAAMLRILQSRPAIVVVTAHPAEPSADPCRWYHAPHFRDGFCPSFAAVLAQPARLDSVTWFVRNRLDQRRSEMR